MFKMISPGGCRGLYFIYDVLFVEKNLKQHDKLNIYYMWKKNHEYLLLFVSFYIHSLFLNKGNILEN